MYIWCVDQTIVCVFIQGINPNIYLTHTVFMMAKLRVYSIHIRG